MKKTTLSFLVLIFCGIQVGGVPSRAQDAPRPGDSAAAAPVMNQPTGPEIADWQARWELAKVLSYMKKFDESLAEYRKLLAEKPDLINAKAEMASVLLWSGKREEALTLFNSLPGAQLDGKTRLAFADVFITDKQYAKARDILSAYLKQAPDDQEARLKLADVLSWEKSYDASIAEFRKILQARPKDIQVRRKLANVLIWANRKEEAVEELKKTLEK
jgi:thioredoxin-like negative regulator of GroEL